LEYTGRQIVNINGADSLDTMSLVVMRNDNTINTESTINLFEQLKFTYSKPLEFQSFVTGCTKNGLHFYARER